MEFLLGIGIFVGAVLLLSLGTVVFRRPLQGSCGGASRLLGKLGGGTCGACGRSYDECPEKESKGAA